MNPAPGGEDPGQVINYEAVLAHELGHTGLGLPDVVTSTGIMNWAYPAEHGGCLHLYPIDVNSAQTQDGITRRQVATAVSTDDGVTWGTPSVLGGQWSQSVISRRSWRSGPRAAT